MSNLKLNIAAIIFAIFALTSCQKETMSELNPTTETTTQRNIPTEGIHIYNAAAKTSATTRTRRNQATSRERNFTMISADAGPIFDDTHGEGNFIDKTWGACLADYAWDFKGEDNVYIFEVKNQPEALVTHHVTISDLTDDVDLFVYTLDENSVIRDCKAISMNGGTTAESVDMQGLEAGFYIIVVDGWTAGVTSSYNMEFYTSAVSANPPSAFEINGIRRVNCFGNVTAENLVDNLWKITTYGNGYVTIDTYVELGRDEWSIYLEGTNQETTAQIDFYQNLLTVNYGNTGGISATEILDYQYVTDFISSILFGNEQVNLTKINDTDWLYDSGIPHFGTILLKEINKDGTTIELAIPEFGANTMGLEKMTLNLAKKEATMTFEGGGEGLNIISEVQYYQLSNG